MRSSSPNGRSGDCAVPLAVAWEACARAAPEVAKAINAEAHNAWRGKRFIRQTPRMMMAEASYYSGLPGTKMCRRGPDLLLEKHSRRPQGAGHSPSPT